MNPVRILIVGDQTLFREGLRTLLADEKDLRIVGEAAESAEALRLAASLKPDVMLWDIRMPNLDGLDVLARLRETSPATKVLILAGALEQEFVAAALREGAKGYVLKTAGIALVVKAIRAVQAGEIWAERKVLTELLDALLRQLKDLNRPLSAMREALTEREQEIVSWVIQGLTNKEIAARLGISAKTVKTHLSNIFLKLNVGSRLQLVLYRLADRADQPTPTLGLREPSAFAFDLAGRA